MRKQTKLWTQKNGDRIRVCDMGDGHLLNTMALLLRYAEHEKTSADWQWARDPGPQGEMAQDGFVQACEEVWDMPRTDYLPGIYWSMRDDACRRGLEVVSPYATEAN